MPASPVWKAVRPDIRLAVFLAVVCCLAMLGVAEAASPVLRYTGRVLYRGNKAPAPGVLVEVVEAEADGKPTDEVLGSARAEADGRFVVTLAKPAEGPVGLVVSAVRYSAQSGGDRRGEGYEIKNHRTPLGYLFRPDPAKPNTVLIERRKPGQPSGDDD